MRPLASLAPCIMLALVLGPPGAVAVDVLPAEVRFGASEALILVRSREGQVRVETDPPTMAAASAPAGEPGDFAPTPRVLSASHTWHGLEGIVVVVLRREAVKEDVEIVLEDGSQTGVLLDWPAAKRHVPMPAIAVLGVAMIAAAKGFGGRGRPRS